MTLGQGVTVNGSPLTAAQVAWPNYEHRLLSDRRSGLPGPARQYYDQNAGRPARQYQYSLSVQREVARDLVVQASYIGNRGIWWPTYLGSPLNNYNYLSTRYLEQKRAQPEQSDRLGDPARTHRIRRGGALPK